MTQTREQSNVRPSLRRLLIVAVIVLVPLTAHAVWDQIEATRMSRAVRAIQQRGEPVNMAAQRRPLENEQQRDASRLYFAAAVLAAPNAPQALPRQPREGSFPTAAVAAALRALAQFPPTEARQDPRFADIESIVESARPALTVLDLATPLDFERFAPERPSYSYAVSDLFKLAAICSLRTDVSALRGDASAAAASQLSSVRLLRTLTGTSSWFVPQTTGSLQLLLERTDPDEAALLRVQQAYEPIAREDGAADALMDRRAVMLESLWPHSSGRPSWVQRVGPTRGPAPASFVLLRPWLTHQAIATLQRFDDAIALARQPWPQKLKAIEEWQQKNPPVARQPFGSGSVIPRWGFGYSDALAGLDRDLTLAGERLAANRVAVVALAVERYRRSHGAALPQALDVLIPDYLAAVPIDPFDGARLRFSRAADGYTIYSVGADQEDDGGKVGEWAPDLLQRRRDTSGPPDIGIQIRVRQVQ
jgi:hypothetical protein